MRETLESKRKPMGTAVLEAAERVRIGQAILQHQHPLAAVARGAGVGLNYAVECAVEYFRRELDAVSRASFRRGRLTVMPNLPPLPPGAARKKAA